jgi:transposase
MKRRPIRADYTQLYLLPPYVDDWVPADHPARFVRDFVDALNLAALGFKMPEALDGRPPYAADLLLKVWLYGYYSKIRSARGLERACCDSMAMVWLTGNHAPDHNTLWRFWRDNRGVLRGIFRESVQVAVKSDLASLVLQAVDGTKIAAQSSTAKAWRADILEKKLERLDAAIEEILAQTERNEAVETGGCRLPAALCDARKRREAIAAALKELHAADRKMMHPKEPEAVVLPCAEGKRLGYNAQAVTEAKNHLIVAADVVAEENDQGQLNPMMAASESNTGRRAEATLADGGYFTGQQIEQAEQSGRDVLVNAPAVYQGDGRRFHHAHFTYDAEHDEFVCPLGQRLAYFRTRQPDRPEGTATRVYRCRCGAACPSRADCTKQARGRTINKDGYYEVVLRQVRKQQEPGNRALLRQRKRIAELPFAWLKHLMGFRRWTVRGTEKVRAQWNLLCTTLNLRILHGFWKKGPLNMT